MSSRHVTYMAHHWLLLAGPAFLPAVVVVGVVLYVAIKDRRTPMMITRLGPATELSRTVIDPRWQGNQSKFKRRARWQPTVK